MGKRARDRRDREAAQETTSETIGDLAAKYTPGTCESCGCELRTTVKTPIDSSLAFTTLLELHPDYGKMSDPEATELRNRFLADWHASGHTDMFAYGREWVARETAPKSELQREFEAGDPDGKVRAVADQVIKQLELDKTGGYAPNTPEYRVWAKAQENGKAAASWVFDGNTPASTYRDVLKGIREGDPAVLDRFREPSLSGEYADDYSEDQLMDDIGWVPHDGTAMRAELADQYNIEVATAFRWEVERLARDQVEPVTEPGELNDIMEPSHVIRVLDEHRVTDAEGSYAPELVMFVDSEGQALPDDDLSLQEQAKSAGWRLLEGWTGQHGYSGPVMHSSKYVGGRLADHILDTPGEYVAVEVSCLPEGEDDAFDPDPPAGWAVAFREVSD